MYSHRLRIEPMKTDIVLIIRHSFKGKVDSKIRIRYYHQIWNKNNVLKIINSLMDTMYLYQVRFQQPRIRNI